MQPISPHRTGVFIGIGPTSLCQLSRASKPRDIQFVIEQSRTHGPKKENAGRSPRFNVVQSKLLVNGSTTISE